MVQKIGHWAVLAKTKLVGGESQAGNTKTKTNTYLDWEGTRVYLRLFVGSQRTQRGGRSRRIEWCELLGTADERERY